MIALRRRFFKPFVSTFHIAATKRPSASRIDA
jgi:hypothetical protein